jgi:hypothetical protein
MNNLTTPVAILISGVLIALVLLFSNHDSKKEFSAKCMHEKNTSDILRLNYTTGNANQQTFIIDGLFELKSVTTREGYAQGIQYIQNKKNTRLTYNRANHSLIYERFNTRGEVHKIGKYNCQ